MITTEDGRAHRLRSGYRRSSRLLEFEETTRTKTNAKRRQFTAALGGDRLRGAELVDIVGGALRVRGGCENRAVVALEDFEPVREIRGVFLAGLGGDFKIGAQKGGSEFATSSSMA